MRKSLKNIQVSIVSFDPKGDKVLLTVNSSSLKKVGWKGDNGNISSAYLTGMLVGKKSIEKGVNEAILDLGFEKSVKGTRLYAAAAGAIEAGLKIPFYEEMSPKKERIAGEHIAKYAQSLKGDKSKYGRQFSNYLKRGLNPEDIVKHFNEIKVKIHG